MGRASREDARELPVQVRPAGAALVTMSCRGYSASSRAGRAPFGGLGNTMMRRAMIEGKCGLPTLRYVPAEATTPARTGRAPWWRLGTTMMRRMIGRYKGFRCAWMGRASRMSSCVPPSFPRRYFHLLVSDSFYVL